MESASQDPMATNKRTIEGDEWTSACSNTVGVG